MDAYLVALEQPLEYVTSYIVDIYTSSRANANQYKQIHQWALRVIENGGNGQIILNDDDLIDFMEIAHKKTYGYFRIHPRHPADNPEHKTEVSKVNSQIYLMFINKDPLPNVNFK